jgi:hypothetical protein
MARIGGAVRAIAVLTAIGICALPATAQVYDPLTTRDVTQMLERAGLTVEVKPSEEDYEGDYVVSKVDAVSFWVHFTGCEKDRTGCALIVFDAGFEFTDNNDRPTLDDINEWNEYHEGKAGLDPEGNPFINIEVNTVGGITRANLADTLQWWKVMLKEFAEFIDWG